MDTPSVQAPVQAMNLSTQRGKVSSGLSAGLFESKEASGKRSRTAQEIWGAEGLMEN
jgi:hypothetical protein